MGAKVSVQVGRELPFSRERRVESAIGEKAGERGLQRARTRPSSEHDSALGVDRGSGFEQLAPARGFKEE